LKEEAFSSQDSDPKVIIRASEPEDRPYASAVRWAAGWAEPPQQHRLWPEADTEWLAQHHYREFVAEVDGRIAGRIGLEAYMPPFAELVDLSVLPEYRRRGLGRRLAQAATYEASRRGFLAVFLQTERDNISAHNLYASLDFFPTALGKMVRMLKFLDYPLVSDFRRAYPLHQYTCTPVGERVQDLQWHAYVTDDHLRLRLRGGSCISDSEGIGPALTECDWRVEQGGRGLQISVEREKLRDIEPGNHVELTLSVSNTGRQKERGIFQMALPSGVRVASPGTNKTQVFAWEAAPGETVTQPVLVQISDNFDAGALWYLNYGSLPVSVETYWRGHRALLSACLPMAIPPPHEG
jgi:ribosomal protein S18 acetylase RimI-like enzyme